MSIASAFRPRRRDETPIFEADALATFAGQYGSGLPFAVRHGLPDLPSVSLAQITVLAASLPRDAISRYRGDLCVEDRPAPLPNPDEAQPAAWVQGVEPSLSRIVLSEIEKHRDYKGLIFDALRPLRPILRASKEPPMRPTGTMTAFSSNAIDPFQLTIGHELHFAVRSSFCVFAYPHWREALVPAADIEKAFAEGDRFVPYTPDYDTKAQPFELTDGQALYLPPGTPYWTEFGRGPGIAFTLRWETTSTDRLSDCLRCHAWLRKRGLPLGPPASAWAMKMKAALFRRWLKR